MKNRRIVIVAFLLSAVMVMGIGFATVTGQLNIMGTAKYNSFSETSSDVHTAVKFTNATAIENCTATITDTTTGDTANLIITFNDTDAEANTGENAFTASAKYTISYETADASLPTIQFSAPTISNDNDKFVVTYEWTDGKDTIAPNGTAELTITVTYETEANETGVQNAIITIPLPYASVAAGA